MGFLSRPLWVAGAVLLASCFAGPAFAAPYTGLYVFGDSLSDTGNAYLATAGAEPVSPPYSDGRFTNGNVWVQDLAGALGLGPVKPSVAGGNDFAVGGAETGTTLAHVGNVTDLGAQIVAYQATVRQPQPGALYTMWIGSNDVDSLLTALAAGTVSLADAPTDIAQAIANIGAAVGALAGDGMKNLLALNVPDLGLTPDARAAGPFAQAAATELSGIFDQALSAELDGLARQDGFSLSLVDTYDEINQIVADPGAFGLSNVTDPCWTGNFTDPNSGTVCSATQAGQDRYLFWDGLHPTAAGHQLTADAALAALPVPEPGSAGLLVIGVAGLLLMRRRSRAASSAPL